MQQWNILPPILALLLQKTCVHKKYLSQRSTRIFWQHENIEKYHQGFRSVLQIVLLLNSRYSIQSNIEDISDECIVQFVEENCFENFEELFSEIDETKIRLAKEKEL